MNYEIVFESERILFVKVSEKLVNEYLKMINDAEVQKNIGKKRGKYTYYQELDWVRKNLKENTLVFSMIDKNTQEFIGNISINKIENNIGELGIVITPLKQNLHFGQEAINALLKYSYDILKLDGMDLKVFNFNKRGIHCYKKLGFVKTDINPLPDEIHMEIRKWITK